MDSIQRNLQGALPEMIAQLRAAPEDLPATFKLYRNLDALYDVMGSVVEGAGAFGSKDDLQSLSNDLEGFEGTRKQLAQRMESLSAAKEAEIVRLRDGSEDSAGGGSGGSAEEDCGGRQPAPEEAGGEEEASGETDDDDTDHGQACRGADAGSGAAAASERSRSSRSQSHPKLAQNAA